VLILTSERTRQFMKLFFITFCKIRKSIPRFFAPKFLPNESFGKNWGVKNLGILLRILQNVIEKSFIDWRVLSLVKINTRISETPCILFYLQADYKKNQT
jgi:hypothetical protein